MKTRSTPKLSRSLLVPALLASASILPSVGSAANVSFDGNGTSDTALATAVNWSTNALPTTSDQVIFNDTAFGGALPATLTNTAFQTWGNVVWDSAATSTLTSSGTARITLSGGGGNTNNDLITITGTKTTGTVSWSFASGLAFTSATIGNINVVSSGVTLNMTTQFEFNNAVPNQVITKTGAGTLSFTNGNNGSLGAGTGSKFVLHEGTLNFAQNNGNMFGGNASTVLEIHNGTALDTAGAGFDIVGARNFKQTWAGDFTYKASTGKALSMGTGAVTMTGGTRQITVNANTLTVGGIIGDEGNGYGLTKAGAGTLALGAVNTYTGATTVAGGTLRTNVANALSSSSDLIVVNGTSAATSGIVNLNGFDQTIAKLSSTNAGAGTTKGIVQNDANNTTATLTVTGTSTFDGTLRNGSNNATRILALAKTTGGTLRLTGTANTYTGGTTISGGTLLANNASGSATGTGAVTVNGGFFGGTGSVSGAITVNAGGSITPGDSGAGTFTGSSLTWNSDNTLPGMTFDLGVDQAASDKLVLSGAFTKGTGSTFVFNFADAGYTESFTYSLVTFGSTTFDGSDFAAVGVDGTFAIVGNTLQFTTSAAIPEPSAYAMIFGALALGGGMMVRRRR